MSDNPYSDTSDDEVEEGPEPHRLDSVWNFESEVSVSVWGSSVSMYHRPTGSAVGMDVIGNVGDTQRRAREYLGSLLTTWTPEEAL